MIVQELRFGRIARLFFAVHCGIIAALVAMHVAVYWWLPKLGLTRTGPAGIFDMHNELSIPNQFSALMLLFGAMLSSFAALVQQNGARAQVRSWLFVSVCLAFMAVDEACGLHDRLADVGQRALNTQGIFLIGWTLPYLLLVLLIATAAFVLLRAVSPRTRFRLAVAGSLFIFFALGFEMAEGLMLQAQGGVGTSYREAKNLGDPPLWDLFVTIEEAGEMVAVALALRALMLHLAEDLHVAVVASRSGERPADGLIVSPGIALRPASVGSLGNGLAS